MDQTFFGFAVVAMLFVMSPGPNGVLILKTVPASGRAAGFANIAGFAAAFYLHGALAVFGLSALLVRSAEAFLIVKILGAAYLFWIGFSALREAWRGEVKTLDVRTARPPRALWRAVLEGFVTNALNPKVALFYLAVFPQFIGRGADVIEVGLALTTIHAAANLIWFSVLIAVLGRASSMIRSGRFMRWLKGATGIVFLGFGWKMATLRP